VDKKNTGDACTTAELDRIMEELRSPEERVRAKAVSKVCPCRMGWEGYQRAMEVVDALRKDASPLVRGAAKHVVEESFQMAGGGLPTSRRMVRNEMDARKRRSRWAETER
jgi:hypothetical protein